jgi:hypothetical protein
VQNGKTSKDESERANPIGCDATGEIKEDESGGSRPNAPLELPADEANLASVR